MNTKVTIAGVEWNNPVTVASGTFGSGAEFTDFVDLNRLGAVTTKGVANVPWTGNPTPRVAETYGGMMNAVGLQNPGIDVFCERDIPFLRKYDTKIILSNVKKQPRRVLHNAFLKEGIDFHTISIASSFQNALKITRRYLKNKEQEEKLPAAEKTEENV